MVFKANVDESAFDLIEQRDRAVDAGTRSRADRGLVRDVLRDQCTPGSTDGSHRIGAQCAR